MPGGPPLLAEAVLYQRRREQVTNASAHMTLTNGPYSPTDAIDAHGQISTGYASRTKRFTQ